MAAVVLTACTSNGTVTYSGPSAPAASPSPSGALIRAIWILSPVGLSLRENPDGTGKGLVTIPQGTQVTASEFRPGSPGWYRVSYNGVQGWLADKDVHSTPPQALVTARPQLAYSNPSAAYYFLYPASWLVGEKGNDVELQGPAPAGATSGSASPTATPSSAPLQAGVTPPRITVRFAPTLDQLGAVPTSSGANLDSTDFEVGGFTGIKRTFSLANGGYEGDIKIKYAADHAVLVTIRSPSQQDFEIFVEVLESFGFSYRASPSPSPSQAP
ncbi:MAG: hypothetical protein NVS3B24_10940 [Candidatus Dormibacteria bacterium]